MLRNNELLCDEGEFTADRLKNNSTGGCRGFTLLNFINPCARDDGRTDDCGLHNTSSSRH